MQSRSDQGAFPWKRNLAVIWIIQFIGLTGLNSIFPLLPLFVREDLGISDPGRVAFWAGAAGAATGMGVFLTAPIWGVVGDRYGHKKNMLRALVGSGVVMALTGISTNVHQLVIFRFFHGFVTGVTPSVMAIAASQTPRDRISFSIGLLQMALFSANAVSPLLGGVLAEALGFRSLFFAGGSLLALGAVLTLFWVKETPRQPSDLPQPSVVDYMRDLWQMLTTRSFSVVMPVMLLVYIAPVMTYPVLALMVSEINPQVSAPTTAGLLFAAMAVASAVAALGVARLGSKLGLRHILVGAACLGGVIYSFMFVAQNLTQMFLIVTLVGLCIGAIMTSATSAVALLVSGERQGRAFGAMMSVSSLGYGIGPLLGGTLATLVGIKEVFLVSGAVFLILALLVFRLTSFGEAIPRAEKASAAGTQAT